MRNFNHYWWLCFIDSDYRLANHYRLSAATSDDIYQSIIARCYLSIPSESTCITILINLDWTIFDGLKVFYFSESHKVPEYQLFPSVFWHELIDLLCLCTVSVQKQNLLLVKKSSIVTELLTRAENFSLPMFKIIATLKSKIWQNSFTF